MKKETHGFYLFVVYDCNDEMTMKVVKRHKDGAEDAEEIDAISRRLLNTTEGLEETAWMEIYKLVGRRSK